MYKLFFHLKLSKELAAALVGELLLGVPNNFVTRQRLMEATLNCAKNRVVMLEAIDS